MKIKDYLRQPNVKWVNHSPTSKEEECLLTAVSTCYPEGRAAIYLKLIEAIIKQEKIDRTKRGLNTWEGVIERTTHGLSAWNDSHTKEDVLALVDRLDI